MRDVSEKFNTLRIATAQSTLKLRPATLERIVNQQIPKGDPLPVAKVAAIQAAKNTALIIPYCHPLPVDHVAVDFELGTDRIDIRVTVKAVYRTGVEMEALTAASVAALTIYDMTKMLDEDMEISGVTLLEKRGGKSDHSRASASGRRAAVLVISDSVAAGRSADRSGALMHERLTAAGFDVADVAVCADDPEAIGQFLVHGADEQGFDVILTTGGTGLGPRDHTPEVMDRVIQRDLGSVSDALRGYGQQRTPFAMLSRGRAGVRGRTVIINLPGSPSGVADAMPLLLTGLPHAFRMMEGDRH